MGNCEDCKQETRLKALEDDSDRNQNTHREFYNKFEGIAIQSALTDERYSTITATLSEIKKDTADLKSKPGKRWESVVEKVLMLVLAGIVGAVLAQAGIG